MYNHFTGSMLVRFLLPLNYFPLYFITSVPAFHQAEELVILSPERFFIIIYQSLKLKRFLYLFSKINRLSISRWKRHTLNSRCLPSPASLERHVSRLTAEKTQQRAPGYRRKMDWILVSSFWGIGGFERRWKPVSSDRQKPRHAPAASCNAGRLWSNEDRRLGSSQKQHATWLGRGRFVMMPFSFSTFKSSSKRLH